MYKPVFQRKHNNVPILSKEAIDHHAEKFLEDYIPRALEFPMEIDIDRFIERYLGLTLDFCYLSSNGVFLGMMVFGETNRLEVFDPETMRAEYMHVAANTVIIDNSLLVEGAEQRYRFTGAHEAGHSVFHTDYFGYNKDQVSMFDQSTSPPMVKCRAATVDSGYLQLKPALVTDEDWMEWQANYFASALLMPKRMVRKLAMDLEQSDFDRDYWLIKLVSETFNVSRTAAENRLMSLGLITPYQIHIGKNSTQETML